MMLGYLICVKALEREEAFAAALKKVDRSRREKALRCASPADRARSLGAGLLLQHGLRELDTLQISDKLRDLDTLQISDKLRDLGTLQSPDKLCAPDTPYKIPMKRGSAWEAPLGKDGGRSGEKRVGMYGEMYRGSGSLEEWNCLSADCPVLWRLLSPEEFLEDENPAEEINLTLGPGGKPYFMDFPFFFSLSHSGDYAMCVFSDREVGADIQQMKSVDAVRLAGRFFPDEERELLAALGPEERLRQFYRLWTRKEAYGKLTGEGAAGALGLCLPGGPLLCGMKNTAGTEPCGIRHAVEAEPCGIGHAVEAEPCGIRSAAELTHLEWREYEGLPGYWITVCSHGGAAD